MTDWVETTESSESFAGKTRGVTYTYEVQALGKNGEWSESGKASKYVPRVSPPQPPPPPPPGRPSAPSHFEIYARSSNTATQGRWRAAWIGSSGATSYRVSYTITWSDGSTSSGSVTTSGTLANISESRASGDSFRQGGAVANSITPECCASVRAINSAGSSPSSPSDCDR